ncbi:MAG: monooxygenase [Betaproteobacteria bacterium]|nr:MAG: monooxygenase [Betaproteobacteria bacterium]
MLIAIVSFKLPQPINLAQATAAFDQTAPKYLGQPGLVRKHYFVTEAGDRAGGIYLWKSKADAQACYSAEWRAMVTAKYGNAPEVVYVENPVSVDNLAGRIEKA